MIKAKKRAYRQMGRKMVPKQMGRFLGNSLTVKKKRKDNRLILLYKGLKVKPGYIQMTLFPRIGVAEISIPWPFRFSLPAKMSICIASSPRLSGTGMTTQNP